MIPSKFIDSRKHIRHRAKEGIIALSSGDICKLIDISEGGASILCIGKTDTTPRFYLDILMKDDKFYAKFPVKLVWEKEVEFSAFTKSIGLQFDNLTGLEKYKVECLIEAHQESEP